MKNAIRLTVTSFLVATAFARAQTFTEDPQEHRRRMGPFGPWSEPVNLGPTINSRYNDITPGISPDGLSLYFDSNRPGALGGPGDEDIWVSRRESLDDPWDEPVNVTILNSTFNDGTPSITSDGHTMYFHSARPSDCRGQIPNGDIYVTHRVDVDDDLAWDPPRNLGCLINTPDFETGPAFFVSGRHRYLYFAWASRDAGSVNKIHLSLFDVIRGVFGPGALVPELSSPAPFNDTRPTIRQDGLELILSSNRPGTIPGLPGAKDLWVSTRRTTHDTWSTPINLGTTVNSEFNESGPQLSANGETLFFSTDKPEGFGGQDLYMATRARLCNHENGDNGEGRCEEH